MNEKIVERHQRWLDTISDPELQAGLQEISKDDEVKSDAFYRYLSFGTSGMRGVIGAEISSRSKLNLSPDKTKNSPSLLNV